MERILQVNINNEGGAFSLVYQIQKRIDKNKYVFDYFTMGEFNRNAVFYDLIKQDSNIYECSLRKNRLIGHIVLPIKFYKLLKKTNYYTIHIHSDSSWKALLYAIPAKFAKVKNIIIHSHSTGINGEKQLVKKILHKITKLVLKRFGTTFIACSTQASKWMFGNTKSKIIIIKNGVDLTTFKPNKKARNKVRQELNYKPENIVIGTVGDFSDTKNPVLLIKIYTSLLKSDCNYRLLFVGSGDNEEDIKQLVIKEKINDKVLFLGRTENVQNVLNAMDAFILPSKFEGLPVSAIEAQATGIPVFLSPNITREAGIDGFSWFADDYLNVENWKELISNNIHNVNSDMATDQVRKAGFDIRETVKAFEKIYEKV